MSAEDKEPPRRASSSGTGSEHDPIPEHVTHLRTVQFTLLLSCLVILIAVYLSLQERRVREAAEQLETFAWALTEEGTQGWEIAIRDQVWETFETPALLGARVPEVPEDTEFKAWLPPLEIVPGPESEELIRLLEDKRVISSRESYLEFLLDLVLLRLPNRSVVLSNPKQRGRTGCRGKLRSSSPRRVRELRLFWQNLENLQAVTFTKARLEGEYQLFIDLLDGQSGTGPVAIHKGDITLQAKPRAAVDDYLAEVLDVAFVAMQPCILEAGAVPGHTRLEELFGRIGVQRAQVYYVGKLDLAPLLADGTPLALRFLLVPERQSVRSYDGRQAMNRWLGGRTGDGSFNTSFPELASIGQREVLITELAKKRAQDDPDWGEKRKRLSGLERLKFDIEHTKVPLPPRPEDRVDLFGAKVQVEDVKLWGGLVLLGVQFYFLLHLVGFIDLLESRRVHEVRAPWIGLYRAPAARAASVVTTSLMPFLICAYLAFLFVERELSLLSILGGVAVTGLSLLVALFTLRAFWRIWSITKIGRSGSVTT